MKRLPFISPRKELEVEVIKHFILPQRQERLLFLQERRRNEFVEAFHTEKFLNLAIATRVALPTPTDIYALMKKLGASDECYAVSAQRELDTLSLPLIEALAQCVGFSIETVLYSPGTGVGYYEGGGYTNRYVLANRSFKRDALKRAP
jgi:hypothetical protein